MQSLSILAGMALLAGSAHARAGDPGASTDPAWFTVGSPAFVVAAPTPASESARDFGDSPAARWLDSPALALATLATLAPASAPAPEPPPRLVLGDDADLSNYLSAKVGEVFPTDSNLDAGWFVGATYGHNFSRLFAIELGASYFSPDLSVTPSANLYAVPVMLNLRLNIPIWIVQAYGGIGGGAMYYNVDHGAFGGDGWLTAGDVFIGADITILDRLTGGLELKYFITDQIRNSNINLDAFTLALTLTFHF